MVGRQALICVRTCVGVRARACLQYMFVSSSEITHINKDTHVFHPSS